MAQLAGELHLHLSEVGKPPPAMDLVIAAYALHLGVPLATRDRDYSAVPGLEVINLPR
jgi:predicted nucleic acid-binding protein